VAVGYSNGANIAAAMVLLGVAKFPEAILLRAMVPLSKLEQLPNLKQTRALISAGVFDPIARVPIAKNLAELFRNAGANVTLRLQSSGHELTAGDVEAAREWLGATR
jgi:phospholipase/carboxylesterase